MTHYRGHNRPSLDSRPTQYWVRWLHYSLSFKLYCSYCTSTYTHISLVQKPSVSHFFRLASKLFDKVKTFFFYVSLTVHLSISLTNDQLDAQIFNTYITILYMYMFRAISCSSSGQIVLIQHLESSLSVSDRQVHRLGKNSGLSQPVRRMVTYWQWRYQMLY